ncbi:MAG: helix-turn-helix domain-containing protein [Bacteroidales bacterium]|nr:helix-turn-helix domain-containing protein [Bacteroidales bacterium]
MSYDIHIGSLIEKRLKDRGCSVTWLAKKINCERTNIYGIFKRDTIDVKRLYEISEALEYDFFEVVRDAMRKEQ